MIDVQETDTKHARQGYFRGRRHLQPPHRRNRQRQDDKVRNDIEGADGDKRGRSVPACPGGQRVPCVSERTTDEEDLQNVRHAPQKADPKDNFGCQPQARVDEYAKVEEENGEFDHQDGKRVEQLVDDKEL